MGGRVDGASEQFGDKLRDMRERAGLTQQELAERANLTPHAVSSLERGTRTRPYPHTVRSLADALQVSEEERQALISSVPRRIPAQGVREMPPPPAAKPSPSAFAAPIDLVVPSTPLYGREPDLAAIVELIRSGAGRLITLTGPGGVGKTRLAAALSQELAGDFPDGVVQISLAALADAGDVVPTIGRELGVAPGDGEDTLAAVAAQLRAMRLMLVLDNFEHLLSAAQHVGRLSHLAPHATVLVTSRSPLRVRGEREYAVEPLALPSPHATTVEELSAAPAGALILDRIRSLSSSRTMTDRDVRALAELCHRQAGLPLAIELASAHLRLLTPQVLLARLTDVMATSGARDLPERQRTMRTTLDWSYGLLSPREKVLFRLLGIFRGGATLEAIEEVAATTAGIDSSDVLGLLGQLVEQSLVVFRARGDGHVRYEQLEPVAEYARSLLIGDEARRAALAHARFFAGFAKEAAAGYEGADQVVWLARAEADEANLLAAIDRSLDRGDGETAARITWAMWLYWWLRGQLLIGRRRAEQCLMVDLPPSLEGRVRLTGATMSFAAGDLEAAAAYWEDALRIGTEHADIHMASLAQAGTGLVALATNDHTTAAERFRKALPLAEAAGEAGDWVKALVHVWLGTVLLLRSEPDAAVREIQRGLGLAAARGDRLSTYIALYNLAQAAIATADYDAARRHLDEGIELSGETQDLANLAYFLEALAVVESAEQSHDRVARLLGAARGLRDTVGAVVYSYYRPDESLRAIAEQDAREALGDEAYATTYAEAAAVVGTLDVEQAVHFALRTA